MKVKEGKESQCNSMRLPGNERCWGSLPNYKRSVCLPGREKSSAPIALRQIAWPRKSNAIPSIGHKEPMCLAVNQTRGRGHLSPGDCQHSGTVLHLYCSQRAEEPPCEPGMEVEIKVEIKVSSVHSLLPSTLLPDRVSSASPLAARPTLKKC